MVMMPPQPKTRVTEKMAIESWLNWHEMDMRKKAITKAQKDDRAMFMEYLQEHSEEGFIVEYEDMKGTTQVRRVHLLATEKSKLDKDSIRFAIVQALMEKEGAGLHKAEASVPKSITLSYITEMVEKGYISSELIKRYEDVSSGSRIKKSKVIITGEGKSKRPAILQDEPQGIQLKAGEKFTVSLGGPEGSKLIKSDGTVILPQITDGKGNVLQEGGIVAPDDEDKPLGGKWAVE